MQGHDGRSGSRRGTDTAGVAPDGSQVGKQFRQVTEAALGAFWHKWKPVMCGSALLYLLQRVYWLDGILRAS
jgi:hypothetical protein